MNLAQHITSLLLNETVSTPETLTEAAMTFAIYGVKPGGTSETLIWTTDPRTKKPITDKKTAQSLAKSLMDKFDVKKARVEQVVEFGSGNKF